MTKIKKTAESEVTANSSVTKPSLAKQTGSEASPTTVTPKSKKSAALNVASPTSISDGVTTALSAASQADAAPEIAPAKPKSTKQEQVLTLLAATSGTTIDEIMKATGWQQHSVRGFFAGTVRKKLGFELTSEKEEGGERRYAIKVAA